MVSKFWMAIIGVIAVAIGAGVVFGPSTLGMNWGVPGNVSNEQIGNLTQKMTVLEQRLDQISKDVMQGATEKSDELKDEMNVLEVQVKRLSDQIDDLKEKLDKAAVSSTVFSAQLSKSEYQAGDTLTLSGTGLPNKSVKISLLGIDRLVISESSVTADSNGNFQFSTPLSKSYASGEYSIKLSQEGKVVERTFRIGTTGTPTPTPVQPPTTQTSTSQGLTISTDKTEYVRGDRVIVSGKTDPDVWIDVDVYDSNKVQLVRTATRSDGSGNYRYDYTLPSNAALGNYEIKVTLGTKQADVKFPVVASTSGSTQTSSSSGSVTITTDKTQYARDSLMKISGKAPVKSKVTITVQPPSGDNMLLTTTASDTGTYTTFLAIKENAVTGSWKISVEADSYVANATVQVI
jgi:5-hydroxyisourate hydrolase-like protein (transthyretin family)